ncbi:NIPSNAP protein [Bacillus oleivorans]|uniref:NIPSNAP protein n=1 Tax=Bacillus oleivorans TaxID=1448271 RepID=A0A285CR02_9BACI|nr:NIPSNAP family protein [Bacillus oleivorans]SNX69951.1 NIPSNAP protein [Bacillus oleivorans]
MFYRRKTYVVKGDFIENFNLHFNQTLLPAQVKYGSRLIGRWMVDKKNHTVEVFAIWGYNSYEDYQRIEETVRSDQEHVKRVSNWYKRNGGRERVRKNFLEVRNEKIESTVFDVKKF